MPSARTRSTSWRTTCAGLCAAVSAPLVLQLKSKQSGHLPEEHLDILHGLGMLGRLNLDMRRFKRKLKAKEQAMHETKVRAIKHGAKDAGQPKISARLLSHVDPGVIRLQLSRTPEKTWQLGQEPWAIAPLLLMGWSILLPVAVVKMLPRQISNASCGKSMAEVCLGPGANRSWKVLLLARDFQCP